MKKALPFPFWGKGRGLFYVLILVLIPGPLTAREPDPQAEAFYQNSLRIREEGDLAESERLMKEALMIDPVNPQYHFELANHYAIRYDEALLLDDMPAADDMLDAGARELEQARMVKPDFVPALFNLGVLYKKRGKYEEAREAFRDVLELDPSIGAARMQIAATYEAQGFYDEAETIYLEMREENAGSPEVNQALQQLERTRFEDKERAMMERSPLGYGSSLLSSNPYGLGQGSSAFGTQQQASAPQAMMAQAVPLVAQWLMQKMSKKGTEETLPGEG